MKILRKIFGIYKNKKQINKSANFFNLNSKLQNSRFQTKISVKQDIFNFNIIGLSYSIQVDCQVDCQVVFHIICFT